MERYIFKPHTLASPVTVAVQGIFPTDTAQRIISPTCSGAGQLKS